MTEFEEDTHLNQPAEDIIKHALTQRKENIAELHKGIVAAETMMQGLPNVTDAMDEFIEFLRTPLRLPEEPDESLPFEIRQAYLEGARDNAQDLINKTSLKAMAIFKSIRAIAQTQISLARHLKHLNAMMLIYLNSDDFTKDAG